MKRSLRTWLIFTACMAVGVAGLAWLSHMVVRLEQREAQARSRAAREERVRLALWRMDSALSTLVALESSRPYFHFRAYYPAQAAYARMYDQTTPGAAVLPSPLLGADTPQVILHFQVDPAGRISSPQVPDRRNPSSLPADRAEKARARLAQLARELSREALLARLGGAPPAAEPTGAAPTSLLAAARPRPSEPGPVAGGLGSTAAAPPPSQLVQQAEEKAKELEAKGQPEAARSASEFAARARQQAASNELANQQNLALAEPPKQVAKLEAPKPGAPALAVPPPAAEATSAPAKAPPAAGPSSLASGAVVEVVVQARDAAPPATAPASARPRQAGLPSVVTETPFRPLWIGEHLLLARTVGMAGGDYLQGCWLDWPAIQAMLQRSIADLLPSGEVRPDADASPVDPGLRLAALPLRLEPGPLPIPSGPAASPALVALGLGWLCALVAGAAAALLLRQALELGERRGAFVSAVTHELRTPLTTFRMYAELLHLGMVTDEAERRTFLETLVVESDRLDHLVKNVLSYARLESGRNPAALEPVAVDILLERACARLPQRAGQAGMQLEVRADPGLAGASLRTDPTVVEQILFNLVDNACKYAAAAVDRRIEVGAADEGGRLVLRVRDHGPGIAKADRRRLFRPFHKSAREAARSAPGVGLGLALCRRLARGLGGELQFEAPADGGACFVLALPLPGVR